MGKASRTKKERKTYRGDAECFGEKSSRPASDKSSKPSLQTFGRMVQVDSNTGKVVGTREVTAGDLADFRQAYAVGVCEAMRDHGAAPLPALAKVGETLGVSILDVKVPVVSEDDRVQTMEDILTATFLLDAEPCFNWLLDLATTSVNCMRSIAVLQQFSALLLPNLSLAEDSAPRKTMATRFVIWAIAHLDQNGELDEVKANPAGWVHQPLAKAELQNHVAKKMAEQERVKIAGALGTLDFSGGADRPCAERGHTARSSRTARSALRI